MYHRFPSAEGQIPPFREVALDIQPHTKDHVFKPLTAQEQQLEFENTILTTLAQALTLVLAGGRPNSYFLFLW